MNNTFKKQFAVVTLLCIAFAILLSIITAPFSSASATESSYSNVLDDLKKDSSFAESAYSVDSHDYSIQVIQVAESNNSELFIYTYQPSGQSKKLIASSINISTVEDLRKADYKNYGLTLLNASGVFFKYSVKNLRVSSAEKRYYTISSILRPFDSKIDKEADYENKITEIPYEVARQYCLTTENGVPKCEAVDIETIEITEKFVGFVRYKDGFKFYVGACDSHFVAFDTNKRMDKLLEADVYYTWQPYSTSIALGTGTHETFGEVEKSYAYLKADQHIEHSGGGLFAGTYEWDRIETVDQFMEETFSKQSVYSGAILGVTVAKVLTEENKTAFDGKKWVLRFTETSYYLNGGNGITVSSSTIVGDVMILRLKFETDGKVYNLGVIDNKQTGSGKPIDRDEWGIEPGKGADILKILAAIAILCLVVFIIYELIKAFISLLNK